MSRWTGTWDGGRTYQAKDGQTVFVLRRMVHGRRFEFVLDGVESEAQAKRELTRFEDDPAAYLPPLARREEQRRQVAETEAKKKAEEVAKRRQDEALALYIDENTIGDFLAFIRERTPKYREDTRRYLADWGAALAERDLRMVSPREINVILSRWTRAEQKRIAALKAFCSFLVKKRGLDPAQDPSRSLTVPAARPEKIIREKGYAMETIERIYAAVADRAVRDVLCLHAKLGLHNSEVHRIATGEGVLTRAKHEVIAGTIRFVHKSGKAHTVSVDAQTFAAAERIQAAKEIPSPDRVRWSIGQACAAAGVTIEYRKSRRNSGDPKKGKRLPSINISELRHSFVAWSLEHGEAVTISGKGVPLALVASVLGHSSTVTTKRFYDVSKYPAMIVLPLKLVHPGDPATTQVEQVKAAG